MEQETEGTYVLSSLSRLRRASQGQQRATRDLREAVRTVAREVAGQLYPLVAASDASPGDEETVSVPGTDYTAVLYLSGDEWAEIHAGYRHVYDRGRSLESADLPREICLDFARAIADGLLDKVAALLEQAARADAAAAVGLEGARTE